MQATNVIRRTVATLVVIIVASALFGAAALHRPKEALIALPPATLLAPEAMVGVPTGEYQNGVPVYRLPSIAVTVNRKEALAQIAREEALAMK